MISGFWGPQGPKFSSVSLPVKFAIIIIMIFLVVVVVIIIVLWKLLLTDSTLILPEEPANLTVDDRR